MDERIDIWDAKGRPTGRTALKSEAHRNGWWHPTVHVWLYTRDGRILLQRRAGDKETFPGLWDVSVAGHLGAGEEPREGALREIEEEIGLKAGPSDLEFLGWHKARHEHPGGIADAEYHHLFLCELREDASSLTPQEGEVDELRLMPLLQFAEETWGLARTDRYVPHGADYYKRIIREIRGRL